MLGDRHQSMNREFVFSANDQVLKDSHCGMDDNKSMGDLQDPKMEVLYHIRPYFVVIFTYIGLKK